MLACVAVVKIRHQSVIRLNSRGEELSSSRVYSLHKCVLLKVVKVCVDEVCTSVC